MASFGLRHVGALLGQGRVPPAHTMGQPGAWNQQMAYQLRHLSGVWGWHSHISHCPPLTPTLVAEGPLAACPSLPPLLLSLSALTLCLSPLPLKRITCPLTSRAAAASAIPLCVFLSPLIQLIFCPPQV